MRSSKKRKLDGRPTKRFTADLEIDFYEKLSQLAGTDSLSHTMERMIERFHAKALRKSAQVEEKAS